jgi:adenylate cyclase
MDAVRANLYFKSADRARGRLHDLPERPTEVWLNLHAPSISHRDVVGATLASTARKDPPGRRFEWDNRAVIVVDIVESVRLVEQDESGIIARWFGFVERVKTQVLPECEGRLVKTLGDGMLLDFGDVRGAVSAALRIQQICDLDNAEYPPERQILLRIGMEVSDVIVEKEDVHGRGVNLAARLMSLAGPGEIVVSQHVRDRLTSTLDAEIEDLGECFLRHVKEPVRAYRIGPPHDRKSRKSHMSLDDWGPSIAVIPFTPRQIAKEHYIIGEMLAEEIIRALSRSPELNVISRLSTTVFRARAVSLVEVASHLQADYVLSGSYKSDGRRVTVNVELAEVKSGRIIWAEHFRDAVSAILTGEQRIVGEVASGVYSAVETREVQRSRLQPLPTLKAYTLLIGAISLMHRLAPRDFQEAHRLLETLLARGADQPIPLSWLANWHVLRVQQGWSPDPKQDAYFALDCTKRALELDPDSALACTIDGSVRTSLLKDLDAAMESYRRAVASSPSNSLAWLLKGTLHAFMNQGKQAVENTQRALKLSPLDPHRYYYESLAATAYIANGQYDRALELAQRSLRANRLHTSTLRVITAAQWRLGLHDEARETMQELLRLEPNFTVSGWLKRTPAAKYPIGPAAAELFRQAGAPK